MEVALDRDIQFILRDLYRLGCLDEKEGTRLFNRLICVGFSSDLYREVLLAIEERRRAPKASASDA